MIKSKEQVEREGGVEVDLCTWETADACMALIPLLGPTHASVAYYVQETGLAWNRVSHALHYLYRIGQAAKSSSPYGDCFGAK